MRLPILFFLCSSLFAANVPAQISVLLAAGKNTFRVTNSGSQGGVLDIQVNPGSFTRIGVTLMPVHSPPATGTTYTACADPCGQGGTASLTTFNQQWGITYPYYELLDSGGNPLSPRVIYGSTSAYEANTCDVPGVIPYIEQPIVTTSPLPMPRDVIALDCWDDYTRHNLRTGHATTNILNIIRYHNITFNTQLRWDSKARVKYNNGSWINLTNSNTDVIPLDDSYKYFRAKNGATYGTIDITVDPWTFGGFGQVGEISVAVPDGLIGSGDTTYAKRNGTKGTDGNSSGWRALEDFLVDGASKTPVTQFVCVSNVCTATATGFNAVSGESVYIRNAPRTELRGPHTITTGGANSFVFTPHAAGSGGSLPRKYIIPDGTYTNPVNRNPVPQRNTDQITTYAYRMLEDAANFAYPDGSIPVDDTGGDVTKGGCLFNYGNESCTPGQTAQFIVPNFNYHSNNRIDAVCGDCHLGGGWDLSYFKVSNSAIRFRSMFHGLTFTQGDYIASYIRSLDATSSPPYQAYLWNPVGQPGPRQDHYTWKKSDSSLTNIVVGSNHIATATVAGETTDIRLNDPVYIHGGTVDTDLNTQDTSGSNYHVTGIATHSIAFNVPSNVSANTYTESTLVINMSNSALASCGIDCQLQFAFDEQREAMDFSDITKFNMNSWRDPRVIPSRVPYLDWMRYFLMKVHPIDSAPDADFKNSTVYLHAQSLFTMTPGNFASYKSKAYADYSDLRGFQSYIGVGIDQGVNNPPDTTNKFNYYPDASPVWLTSDFGAFRYAVQQYAANAMFTLATKYGVLSMNAQVATDVFGATSAPSCYVEVGIHENGLFFNEPATHKSKMPPESISDGLVMTWYGITDAWYMFTAQLNDRGCHNAPDTQIDRAYIGPFSFYDGLTPGGYESEMLPSLYASQMGRGMADLNWYCASPSPNCGIGTGQDWTGPFSRTQLVAPGYGGVAGGPFASFWWFSTTRWTEYVNTQLSKMTSAIATRDIDTYWHNIGISLGDDFACNSASLSWASDHGGCDLFELLYTYYISFGADPTMLATLKSQVNTWYPAFAMGPSARAEAAGVEGDASIGASGGVPTAGTHVITFTSCPTSSGAGGQYPHIPYRVGTVAPDRYELLYPSAVGGSGDTCVAGMAGTLTFITARNHSGTLLVYRGLSAVHQEPNWPADLFGQEQVRSFKASNME